MEVGVARSRCNPEFTIFVESTAAANVGEFISTSVASTSAISGSDAIRVPLYAVCIFLRSCTLASSSVCNCTKLQVYTTIEDGEKLKLP
ncbi:MAG: hypothetical protein H6767_09350 [Candidatus Peribacteria bacterium]|nr:MAG: hypothetical protein H6767_09350 [Candidatus Peribacteria bacterium]